jgi:hypothetical protein
VYRGKRVPPLVGLYLYGDYVNGKLWALRYDEDEGEVVANYSIRGNTQPIMSFGEDEHGEVYFMVESGGIYRFKAFLGRLDHLFERGTTVGRGRVHVQVATQVVEFD